jgi:hypothetical protein
MVFLLRWGLFEECPDEQEVFVAGAKGGFGDVGLFQVVEDLVDVAGEIRYFDGGIQLEGGGERSGRKECFEGLYFFGGGDHGAKINVGNINRTTGRSLTMEIVLSGVGEHGSKGYYLSRRLHRL